MQSFFVIGAFIALGVLARRFLTLPDRAPFWINRLIIFASSAESVGRFRLG